jgi:ribonuclease-3
MSGLEKIKSCLAGGNGPELLQEAFTHRSYAVEHGLAYDNQRLEFLGDAVIETILSEHLFRLYPEAPEGLLTQMRSALVCESALARLARRFDLGAQLRIGNGEAEIGGSRRESTLADLFEAVIGALFLGAGFDVCRSLLLEVFSEEFPCPRELLLEINPKGKLQELSQHYWNKTPSYRVFQQTGPQHAPEYIVEVVLKNWTAYGSGKNRKTAEFDAARSLYDHLERSGIKTL